MEGPTILPTSFKTFSQKTETTVSIALGQHLAPLSPVRQAVATYLDLAGIEAGYNYFAPNVPGGYKLVFELHYSDGRVEYEVPSVSSRAAGLRIQGLLDGIGRIQHDVLREHLVKTLTQSAWRENPEVKMIRAVFGAIVLPSVTEVKQGKRASYKFLYAYDFSLQDAHAEQKDR